MSEIPILKQFVSVGDRLVHYRVSGAGAPVILLHDSVKSSSALLPLIRRLNRRFRVFALDTPGYGNSDPLSGIPAIGDFARSVKETMDALGVASAGIYGRHTSSKIVLELLIQWPELFEVGIMDGLSFAEPPNTAETISKYLPPFAIDEDGAYLARVWTQISDIVRWFPWYMRTAGNRMAVPIRDDGAAHLFALDFLMAGPSYSSGYGAALRYDGWPRLKQLASSARAVFMTAEDDVLYPFLDRLPEDWTKERVPPGSEMLLQRVEAIFERSVRNAKEVKIAAQPASRYYIKLPHGQVHLRTMGRHLGNPTLYLHDVPGGCASKLPFLSELAKYCHVIAPDLPGCGESDPLRTPDAHAYADTLAAIVEAEGLGAVNIIASTATSRLAIAFADRHPDLVSCALLDGFTPQSAEFARHYCPPIQYDPSGSHLFRVWHMLRNAQVQWPWYGRAVETIRWVDADLRGEGLHADLVDVLKQPGHYGDAARAAFAYDAEAALTRLKCPLYILTVKDDPARTLPPEVERACTPVARPAAVGAQARQAALILNKSAS